MHELVTWATLQLLKPWQGGIRTVNCITAYNGIHPHTLWHISTYNMETHAHYISNCMCMYISIYITDTRMHNPANIYTYRCRVYRYIDIDNQWIWVIHALFHTERLPVCVFIRMPTPRLWADVTPRPLKVEQLPWTHRWRPGNTTRHATWQKKSLKLLVIAGGCQHHDMRRFFCVWH